MKQKQVKDSWRKASFAAADLEGSFGIVYAELLTSMLKTDL